MEITIKEQMKIHMGRIHKTQTDLAKDLGITRAAINNFFSKEDAKLSDLDRYAAALGCNIKVELITDLKKDPE